MKKFFLLTIISVVFLGCLKKHDPVDQNLNEYHFDQDLLNEALMDANSVSGLYSLLISRYGDLVIEKYYHGFKADSLHDVRSVTKSITSILVGIAMDKGYIPNVDAKMFTYIEPLVDSISTDKHQISIKHLLTMSGGFQWPVFNDWSEYNNWRRASDQIEYIIQKPLVNTPGSLFNYNDAASHLLSVIVGETSGKDVIDFARQYLFSPLGIDTINWIRDNRGYPLGAVALSLKSRDMLKIGNLFLYQGNFQGNRVVSAEWVQQSIQSHITNGNVIPFSEQYGYLWWIGETNSAHYYMAMGYGGQFILIVPGKELVVVATCNWRLSSEQTGKNWFDTISLIVNKIIPAAK